MSTGKVSNSKRKAQLGIDVGRDTVNERDKAQDL